jgi:WhiB family redox-sensing transcriptional regulator
MSAAELIPGQTAAEASEIGVKIPIVDAAIMHEGNKRVNDAYPESSNLILITDDHTLRYNGAEIKLPPDSQNTADLLADMITKRALTRLAGYNLHYLPGEDPVIRSVTAKRLVAWLNRALLNDDGSPLVSQIGNKGGSKFGITRTNFRDLRHSQRERAGIFKDTVEQIEYFLETGEPVGVFLIDELDFRAARQALQQIAGRDMGRNQTDRFIELRNILQEHVKPEGDSLETAGLIRTLVQSAGIEYSSSVYLKPEDRPSWEWAASCRGTVGQLFFPPSTFERKEEKIAREARAKEICRTCPVKKPCLEQAIKNRERDGVWGGYDASELKAFF